MALRIDETRNQLEEYLKNIQNFDDSQKEFYREKESNYYHKILEIINFIQNRELDNSIDLFYTEKDLIKDFHDFFLSNFNTAHYHESSPQKRNFFSTVNKIIEIINNYKKENKNEISALTTLKDEIKSTFSFYEETFKIFNRKVNEKEQYLEEVNKKVSEIKKSAENAETAFKENHKLYEARQYWAKKSKNHFWQALGLFIFFVVIITALAYITYARIETVKKQDIALAPMQVVIDKNSSSALKSSPELLAYQKKLQQHELIRYIQYLFLLSLILWLLRILLKMLFSNLHLKEEAHEKETMILTYLALINEGGNLENDDRKLILEAIFRPSTNGLIKDESNVTLLDIVKTIKK